MCFLNQFIYQFLTHFAVLESINSNEERITQQIIFRKELFLKLQDNKLINVYPFLHFLAGANLTATAPSIQDLASTVTASSTIGDNLTSSHTGTLLPLLGMSSQALWFSLLQADFFVEFWSWSRI